MKKLSVSMSVGLYDRTFPLFDGQVQIEGCDLNAVPLLPEECFHRALIISGRKNVKSGRFPHAACSSFVLYIFI